MQKANIQSIEEGIKLATPPIALFGASARDILTLLLVDLVKFFNVGKSMGEFQVKQTIDLLLGDIETKNLKPEEFKLIFTDMKKGEYGQLFDRLDGAIIIMNCKDYARKRAELVQSINDNQTLAHKNPKNDGIHPEIVEMLAKAKQEIKPAAVEVKEKPKREPTEIDKFLAECMAEFDKLYKDRLDNGKEDKQLKVIEFEGKIVSLSEYLEMRVKNGK